MFGIKLNFSMISQIALAAATGGASAAITMAAKQIATQMVMDMIGKVGQQLGLPPAMISMAQSAFANSAGQPQLAQNYARNGMQQLLGDVGQQFNFSPSEQGQIGREVNDIQKQLTDSILKRLRDGGSDEEGGSTAGESRLVKLAKAMGKLLDKKMDKMIEIGDKMDSAKKQGSLSAQMQALSQEMGLISQALSTTIKSIGEANATLARKS